MGFDSRFQPARQPAVFDITRHMDIREVAAK